MGWVHDRQINLAGESVRAHVHVTGGVADRIEAILDPAGDVAVVYGAVEVEGQRYRVASLTRRHETAELRLEPLEQDPAPQARQRKRHGKPVS